MDSHKKLTFTAKILALIIISIGISVEIGWYFDIVILKSIFPDIVNMNPITALSFIFLGTAIFLLAKDDSNKNFIRVAYFVAAFVFLTGFFRMLGLMFGIDIHHDQILFHDKVLASSFGHTRIAPNTAINMIIIGSVLFLITGRKYYYFAHVLNYLTFVISLLAILGYLYSAKNLYGFLSYTPMALNTSISFLITSLAFLFVSKTNGAMRILAGDSVGGRTVRILLPFIVVIPTALGWLRLEGEKAEIFGPEYGTSLFVISAIIIFMNIVFEFSRRLHNADMEQKALMLHIEDLVAERTQQFKEEQARLEASINNVHIGYLITDKDGTLISANTAAQTILEQASVTTDFLINYFVSQLDLKKIIAESLTQKKAQSFKQLNFGKKYIDLFITPIIPRNDKANNYDEIIGVVILLEDVTEEKILQRSHEEFFSIASHELRTPLTAIYGNSAMLLDIYKENLVDPNMREAIEDIRTSSIRLIKIVSEFIDSSRLEQKQMKFNNQQFNLLEIIDQVINVSKPEAEQKKLTLTFNKPQATFVNVFADQEKTKQILAHMMSNAIIYTQIGSITLDLQTDNPYVVKILVKDTGRGIAKQNEALLFRKFQQAGENLYTRESTKGTGIGLYLAKLMAEGMGGAIKLEHSEEGKGSIFSLTLPRSKQ